MPRSPFTVFTYFFFSSCIAFAQSEINIQEGCSFSGSFKGTEFYTFESSDEADSIVSEIMALHSLPKNFVIRASNVSNALATTDTQSGQRFILYNTSFLEKFKKDANTRWASYSVLAHEVGHHLCSHDFGEKDARRRKLMELEADRFAGGTLCLLGATLEESQAGLNTFALDGESETHPSKTIRLEAIASEWKKKEEWMKENGLKPKLISKSETSSPQSSNRCDYCSEMILVSGTSFLPNSSFKMGNNKVFDEKPLHNVTVQDFEIGKHEVTNREFCLFLSEISSKIEINDKGTIVSIDRKPIFKLLCNEDFGTCEGYTEMIEYEYGTTSGYSFKVKPGYENFACAMVTWYGAKAYCDWLTYKTGFQYRLPTESEWEFAAKGGVFGESFKFSGSDNPDEVAWYKNTVGRKKQFEVGKKKANALGVHDMSGSLWEWCEDCWHDNYAGHPIDGSAWIKGDCPRRVLRGGSSSDDSTQIRVSVRGLESANYSDHITGFRLVKSK